MEVLILFHVDILISLKIIQQQHFRIDFIISVAHFQAEGRDTLVAGVLSHDGGRTCRWPASRCMTSMIETLGNQH